MAVTARGFKSVLNLAYESTFGVTPATPVSYRMPIITSQIAPKQSLENDPTLTGRRDPTAPTRGNIDVSGQVVVPVDLVAWGYWLKALCGAPTTTGSGDPYSHVFKMGDDVPSLVLEQAYDSKSYALFNGCKISKVSIPWGGAGVVQATIDVIGAKHDESETSFDTDPTIITPVKFQQFEGTIAEGGTESTIITSASVEIDAGLDGDMYGSGGVRADVLEGQIQINGSITAFFQNETLLNKALNGTESSLKLTWTKGTHSFEIFLPEVVYERTSPGIDGPNGIRLQMNYRAYLEDAVEDAVAVFTLKNNLASYAVA